MKILYLLPLILLLGCVSLSYNPTTGEVRYSRIGNQKIQDIQVETKDGVKISINNLENSELEALKGATEASLTALTRGGLK